MPSARAWRGPQVESCHKARQFTDTANFTLRCGVCQVRGGRALAASACGWLLAHLTRARIARWRLPQIGLKGEKEAVEHAKATGHQNFTEY